MINRESLFENVLYLGVLQIFSYVFALFVYAYLVQIIGTEKCGLIFFVFSFIQYFIILCDYGFDLSATREIAINRHNKNNLSNIFSSVMVIKTIFLLLSFFILSVFFLIDRFEKDKMLFLSSFGMVISSALFPVWFFQGMEKMKYIPFFKITSQILFFTFIFIFVKRDSDFVYIPVLSSLCYLFFAILSLYFVFKKFKVKFYIPKYKSIKKQFIYSSEFFLSKVSLSLCSNTNTLCLGFVSGDMIVGLYVSAEKIYTALKSLWMPIHNAFFPYMTKTKDIKLYRKILKYGILLNTLICILVYQYAEVIIKFFFGTQMLQSVEILRIFSIIQFVTIPSIMLGYPLLGTTGGNKGCKIVNRSILASTLFYSMGLFALYMNSQLNMYSVTYLILLTDVFLFLYRLVYVIKYKFLKNENNYKDLCNEISSV